MTAKCSWCQIITSASLVSMSSMTSNVRVRVHFCLKDELQYGSFNAEGKCGWFHF